jgi:tetratricopeptide (TPR) repeat protein
MPSFLQSGGPILGLCLALAAGRAAADEGRADLDKATQLRIGATSLNDLSEVVRLCDSALAKGLDQNNVTFAKNLLAGALFQRGSIYADQVFHSLAAEGKWQESRKLAAADLERAVALRPAQPQALILIARLNLLPGGDAKRADEALDQAIAQSGDEPQLKGEALVLRASAQKEPAKRLADLDEAIQVAPGDAAVYRARGIVRAEMNKLAAALDDLNKSIALDPAQPLSYQLKALILAKQQKLDEALDVLEKARSLLPRNADLPLTKAQILRSRADYPAALQELDRVAAINGDNLEMLLARAAVYKELSQTAKALDDVDHLLRLRPHLPGLKQDRAMLLAELGKYDEAAAQLDELRRANPKDPVILMRLATLCLAQKHHETAVKYFSEVLGQYPNEWTAHRGRADALLALGRRGEAIADYDKAQQLRPKDVGILNNLAWVLATAPEAHLRDGKRALVLAQEVAKLTGYKQDFVLSTLAAAYAEAGDFQNARRWAAKAVELGGKENAEQIKQELESYKAGKPWREVLPAPEEKKDKPAGR